MIGERPVVVVQHVPWEGPGLIGDALDRHGIGRRTATLLDAADPVAVPPLDDLAGLVVMGGPMGALDTDVHPGLAHELELVRRCARADVPVLGVCLGHQIAAVALGANLHRGGHHEIGLAPVDVHDDVLGPHRSIEVLHWHGDAVDLPAGARLLASSPTTPNQAFRLGSVTGLQFHLEVDQGLVDRWLATPAMADDLGPEAERRLRATFPRHAGALRAMAARVFDAFARQVLSSAAERPAGRRR